MRCSAWEWTDWTTPKGVEERFLAVERLLEKHPEFLGRFTFVQLAAPSRTLIERYRQLNESIEQVAARINERFGQGSYRPIILRRIHHEPPDVFRYYRAADLCYVSSLHDGMNLVAKEFVAAREDERGVLVLSQFTGAARELTEALIVNPYDTDEAAAALVTALNMSPEEQRERMRSMRAYHCRIQRLPLGGPHAGGCGAPAPPRAADRPAGGTMAGGESGLMRLHFVSDRNLALLRKFAAANALAAFDFDGTLAPVVSIPEDAALRPATHRLMRHLASLFSCIVVTGRGRKSMRPKLHGIPFERDRGKPRNRALAYFCRDGPRGETLAADSESGLGQVPGVLVLKTNDSRSRFTTDTRVTKGTRKAIAESPALYPAQGWWAANKWSISIPKARRARARPSNARGEN